MTSVVLLDTSVVVAAERGKLDLDRLVSSVAARVAISAITASELVLGVLRRPAGLARARGERDVAAMLSVLPVVPVDLEVARVHAALRAELGGRGLELGAHDMLIGATALAHDFELATRDRAFTRIPGLVVHCW